MTVRLAWWLPLILTLRASTGSPEGLTVPEAEDLLPGRAASRDPVRGDARPALSLWNGIHMAREEVI